MKNKTLVLFLVSLTTSVTLGTAEVSDILPLENLAIPPALGKMDDRFQGQSERWVVHIQDIHAHSGAQENIAALIEHLHTYYGINVVAIEAGWSATSFPKTWALPPSRRKQMLARALLEEAYITGPIHAALFAPTPIKIAGIEDKKLYEANRRIYIQHLAERETVQEKVKTLEEKINRAKSAAFNPDLLAFDRTLVEFREGRKADKFIPSLFSQAGARGADLSDLNQVSIFKKAFELEREINKEKLQAEAGRLMNEFRRKGLHFEELLKNGEIPDDKLEFYPEAQKYLQFMHTQDQINHHRFFAEIETAITRIKEKLVTSEEEKTLDRRASALVFAKKIILFQATPDDLKAFSASEPEARADADGDLEEAGLAAPLALGLQFYELARQRDRVFFERIANHPKLQGNIAVVTGGFHTEGLSAQFEEAGISYTVITPDIGDQPVDEALYFKRLNEDASGSQTLGPSMDWALHGDRAMAATIELSKESFGDLKAAVMQARTYNPSAGIAPDLTSDSGTLVEFKALSPDEQKIDFQKAAEAARKSTSPEWLFIKAPVLTKILTEGSPDQTALAQAVWRSEVRDPGKKIVILYDSVPEILNIPDMERPNIIRLQQGDFDRAVSLGQFRKARDSNAIAIIDGQYQGKAGYLLRKETLTSLALWSLLIQKGLRFSPDDEKALALYEQFLEEIFQAGFFETAA